MKNFTKITAILSLGLAAPAAAQEVTLELPYLSVFSNHGVGGTAPSAWFEGDTDAAVAARLTGTFDAGNGRAIRASLFSFSADTGASDTFEVHTFGVEGVFDPFGDNGFSVFAGLRAANITYSDENPANIGDFTGFGPTLGAEYSADLGNGLSFDASGRIGFYFGSTDITPVGATSNNTFIPTTEIRIGGAYDADLGSVSMTIGAGFEFQSFSSLSFNGVSAIDPEDVDVGLAGPYLSATFRF